MGYYKDTVGLTINIETGADIATATDIALHVKKPNGKWYEWSTGITIQGSDNSILRYITQNGDLNYAGYYLIYPSLTLGGFIGDGNPDRFLIEDPQKPEKTYNP
jgi:hypothetical protein